MPRTFDDAVAHFALAEWSEQMRTHCRMGEQLPARFDHAKTPSAELDSERQAATDLVELAEV